MHSVSNARHLLSKWNSGLQREEQSVCDPARFGSSSTPELSSTQNVNVTGFVSARHLLEMSFVQTQNPESFSSDYEYSQPQSLSPVKSSSSPVHSAVRPNPELYTVMQSQEDIHHSPSLPNSQQSLFESDEVIPDSCNSSQQVPCGSIPNVRTLSYRNSQQPFHSGSVAEVVVEVVHVAHRLLLALIYQFRNTPSSLSTVQVTISRQLPSVQLNTNSVSFSFSFLRNLALCVNTFAKHPLQFSSHRYCNCNLRRTSAMCRMML